MAQHPREPLLGLLLSIVLPGLGQMYAGKFIRGVLALLIVIAPVAGLVWFILLPSTKIGNQLFVLFSIPLVFDVIVMADAYVQVVRYNASHNHSRVISKWALAMLYAGMVSAVIAVNVFFAGVSVIRAKLVNSFVSPADSMAPSIYEGEHVWVAPNAYKKTKPKRGDIVVYHKPAATGSINMHRIMGLPGESVELRDHRVVINGTPVRDDWCLRIRYYNGGKFGQKKHAVKVPEDSYYVVGDASATSNDSRYWGFVPKANLIGKVFKIYYPFDRSGPVAAPGG